MGLLWVGLGLVELWFGFGFVWVPFTLDSVWFWFPLDWNWFGLGSLRVGVENLVLCISTKRVQVTPAGVVSRRKKRTFDKYARWVCFGLGLLWVRLGLGLVSLWVRFVLDSV